MNSYSYTNSFATCLDNARAVRDNLKLKYIGTETLLHGIITTENCDASKILAKHGCVLSQYNYYFRKSLRPDNRNDYTPKANAAIIGSKEIAVRLSVNFVSAEHLLLSILKIQDCVAVSILRAMGININELFSDIVKIIKVPVKNSNNLQNVSNGNVKRTQTNLSKEEKTEDDCDSFDTQNNSVKSKKNPLDGLGFDLTLRAREQKLDPVIGRDEETERLIQTLARKTKNNPVLIGEAGVGKSAVVEGLAAKIVKGEVPETLRGKIIYSLDLGGLVAGTKFRGEFEGRLKSAIDYVKQQRNIILFIDEIHNLIGVGSSNDSKMDASEMLKPMLSRGEISVIGATTVDEYRKYIEKDQALERRFQPIYVKEPTKEQAIDILLGLKSVYEAHHKVKIKNEAIYTAVNLSDRYIHDRFLPDKAIDLIDEAASKKRVEATSVPKIIIELERKIKSLTAERDYTLSRNNLDEARKIDIEISELVKKIRDERTKNNVKRSQFDYAVTDSDIKELISVWTKIPVGDLTDEESDKLIHLEEELSKRVIGQSGAIKSVARAIKRSGAKLKDPNKPIGSFIFVGPTGVGKSELSKAVAECVFDDKEALIRFDMSEYTDKTSVNKLIGSAPGYVGYEEEGLLTEKIRRNPYSVVLFDEIEKADPEIFDLLLQVLDEGRLTDSKGRLVSFKDAVIILTSNVGYGNNDNKATLGFGASEDTEKNKVEEVLKSKFRPEFINRIDEIVIFNKLTEENCREITVMTLNSLKARLDDIGIELSIDESAIDFIVKKGYSQIYGARPLKRAVSRYVEDILSDAIIVKDIVAGDRVTVYEENGEIQYFKD